MGNRAGNSSLIPDYIRHYTFLIQCRLVKVSP
jgi:hypothetical protein